MKFKLDRTAKYLLSILGACVMAQGAQAQKFADTNSDLILTFRTTGSTVDYEVDLGQASLYYNASASTVIPITAYNSNNLASTFPSATGLGGIGWSVVGTAPISGTGDPHKPLGTIWVTDPRTDPSMPATAWVVEGFGGIVPASGEINDILYEGGLWATNHPADSMTNTPTTVTIPTGSGFDASGYLGAYGNLNGKFQGDIENTTPSLFAYLGSPSRSDLYELDPGGPNKYLGYFELDTDGSMTFYGPSVVASYPAPSLSTSTDGAGNVYISFTSSVGGTYTLHYTGASNIHTPVSTWSTVSTNIIGDGTIKSFQQTVGGAGASMVYSVTVH